MKVFLAAIGWIILAGWYFWPEGHETTRESFTNNTTKLWVVSGRLNRRTCSSKTCGVVGRLFFREGVVPLEIKDNWARITNFYDASCVNGKSEYIDSGNNKCTVKNGISEGRFAEWVSIKFLSKTRPADPVDSTFIGREVDWREYIAQSDDFNLYQHQFAQAAEKLIEMGQCSEADFQDIGGFLKSTNHATKPIYFIYCGGFTAAHRIYVNVKTGKISRY